MTAVLFFHSVSAMADVQGEPPSHAPIFGPEFTLTNDEILRTWKTYLEADELYEEAMESNGKVSTGKLEKLRRATDTAQDRYTSTLEAYRLKQVSKLEKLCTGKLRAPGFRCTVQSPGVFIYEIEGMNRPISVSFRTDPGVIEIQMSPMSLAEWKSPKVRAAFQGDIFDLGASKDVGLRPHPLEGGGHVNIGYQYLQKDPDLFVALTVDIANHPELSMGGFGIYDPEDAIALAELDPKARKRFGELVAQYHDRKITAETFARRVNDEVYAENPVRGTKLAKYHATNVTTVSHQGVPPERKRVEFRPVRTQMNLNEFIRDAELFDARIRFLEKRLAEGRFPEFIDPAVRANNIEELARRYQGYIKETGLTWDGPGGYKERARAGPWGDVVDHIQDSCIQRSLPKVRVP